MLFDSHKVAKSARHMRLYAEMQVQFENSQNESISFGTPKGWDELISHCVELEQYNAYYIYSCTMPNEKVNRITDHKRIWGLLGMQEGVFTGEYTSSNGKVYFGVSEEPGDAPLSADSSALILLVKRENEFNGEDVFKIFKEHQYIFGEKSNESDLMLMQLSELYDDSIMLKYDCISQVSLDVYGENVERLFANADFDSYNKHEDEPVWRRPCS